MGNIKEVISNDGSTTRFKAEAVVGSRRKSKRLPTRAKAVTWIKETEIAMKERSHSTASGVTFGDALRRFAEEIAPDRKGHKSELSRINKVCRLPIADIPLEEMDLIVGKDYKQYLKERGLANDSITREFTLLKVVLRQCDDWYHLPYPWTGLKMPPQAKPRNRLITDREVETFVAVAGYIIDDRPITTRQKVGAMFLFAIETGMREGEIAGLTPKMLDLARSVAKLPDWLTKTDSTREVPLSDKALKIIDKLPDCAPDTPVFGVSASVTATTFGTIRKLCGWTNRKTWFRFHDTRHLACTRMGRIPTMTPMKLARILGHSDVNQTMDYFNPDMSLIGKEMRDHQISLEAGTEMVHKMAAMNMTMEDMKAFIERVEREGL